MAASVVVVGFFLFGMFASSGEALKCYVCNGLLDTSCNEPFKAKAEFKTPCNLPNCSRLTVSNERFKNVIMRTCGPAVWEKITDQPLGVTYSKASFNCTSDYCNQSSNQSASSLLLFSSVILAFFVVLV